MSRLFRLFGLTLALLGLPAPLLAAEVAHVSASHSEIAVAAEASTVAAGRTVWLGITITPRAGWHIYWKNPGDSGAAPIFDWKLPRGVEAGTTLFPVPEHIPVGPLANYGYGHAVTLLVPVTLASDFEGALNALVEAEWLVCDKECVPQLASFEISIPAGDGALATDDRALFTAARAALPEPSYWDATLTIEPESADLLVYMAPDEANGVTNVAFFPEDGGVLAYAAQQAWHIDEDGLSVSLQRPSGAPKPLTANGVLVLTTADGARTGYAVEPMLKLVALEGAAANVPAPDVVSLPIWQAVLFALIGGLILNLMPCVFPVLSLKAFAFASANYKTVAHRRREGWAYTAGIWVSFMVIVAALQALRAGGTAVGWGFQLQEPVFVGLMAILIVVVALSLSGLFSIQLGAEGAGQGLAAREGVHGAFFKGILAALVATPCTAPFMAPAIGFALTQPLPIVFLIFSFLALGLALPFLLLSYSPMLARMMPKPGPWMEKVKEGLAFPMYLTAAWLVYVFDRQVGAAGTLMLVAAIILIAFSIWLARQGEGQTLRVISWAFALLALFVVVYEPWDMSQRRADVEATEETFSPAALEAMRAGGAPVFVYFTADWCITCKVNERIALFTDTTQEAFRAAGVRMMKGDWTNRNAEIAAVLARYGRAGVPLYLFYPAGAAEPIVLPEILGPGTIADIVRQNS